MQFHHPFSGPEEARCLLKSAYPLNPPLFPAPAPSYLGGETMQLAEDTNAFQGIVTSGGKSQSDRGWDVRKGEGESLG